MAIYKQVINKFSRYGGIFFAYTAISISFLIIIGITLFTMINTEYIVLLCGIYSVGFAVFHILFWRLFSWKKDLEKLSRPNKAIVQILNIRLIYFFLFVALACFLFPKTLTQTEFGKFFLGGISVFWLGRTVEQFIFLRINHPSIHILTITFILGSLLFGIPVVL